MSAEEPRTAEFDAAAEEFALPRSRAANARLRTVIPGGAHTYAKGEDQYPEDLAPVISHGRGAHVWDVDGNRYVEYGSGLRSVSLGHAHPRVTEAVRRELDRGANFVRPSVLEAEAAERFLATVPTAEMVKFAKNGSDATTAAVRLARAATGRPRVAICADHPFFSVDDWFIGTTAMSAGIPAATTELTVSFPYGDLAATEALLGRYEGEIACLVLEPAAAEEPPPGYLEGLRALADRHGCVLVFDEMITGFRWSEAGAQGLYGVTPDLSTFGKALGNGFAVSALAGRRELMERGGLRHSGDRVFLLSTTHGAETHSLARRWPCRPPTWRRASPPGCTPSASGWPPGSARPPPAWASASTSSCAAGPATWSSRPWTRTEGRPSRTAPCSCAGSSWAGCWRPRSW